MPTSYVVHDLIGFWDREWMHMGVSGLLIWGHYTTCVDVLVPGSNASTTVTIMEYHANASNLYYFA